MVELQFDQRCFRIGASGYVVALSIFAQQTTLDYDDPSLLAFPDPHLTDDPVAVVYWKEHELRGPD